MFEQVKQEIDNTIKTNGNNEITATRLNGVLQDMMDAAAEEIENVAESVGDQVEANPAGEATTTLNKIKIGETIYKTNNPFAGAVEATDAERLQALANVSNQEAGYDESDPPVFTGKMGYVVLQPETNDKTTFAAQIANKPNTIFEIREVFDLSGTEQEPATVTIPANCKLRFEGGMLVGEYVTLQGNNTLIESDSVCIKKGVAIGGTWANDTIYTKWLEFVSVKDAYLPAAAGTAGVMAPIFEDDTYYESGRNYVLLNEEPDDWPTNYTDYFQIVDNEYVSVTPVAPTYSKNTYYKKEGDTYTILDGDEAPIDWNTNYSDYYTKSGNVYTPVAGVKPDFVEDTFYEDEGVGYKQLLKIPSDWYTNWSSYFIKNGNSYETPMGIVDNPNATNNIDVFKQLESLINGSEKGCKVEFEKGYYQVRVNASPLGTTTIGGVEYEIWKPTGNQPNNHVALDIKDIPSVKINLNQSHIKALVTTCPDWNVMRVNGCDYVDVHNGIVEGFAAQFNYPSYKPSYYNGLSRNYEFPVLCKIFGKIVNINGITACNSEGDAFMVGSSSIACDSWTIENTEIHHCGRNGITVYSSNFARCNNTYIHHIGSDGDGTGVIGSDNIMGRNPRAGIDIEFEDKFKLNPIMELSNMNITNCGNSAISEHNTSVLESFTATNMYIHGCLNSSWMRTKNGKPVFNDSTFIHEGGTHTNIGTVLYNNCHFVLKKPLFISQNTFKNCTIVDAATDYSGFIIYYDESEKEGSLIGCTLLMNHNVCIYRKNIVDTTIKFNTKDVYVKLYGSNNFKNTLFESLVDDTYNNTILSDSLTSLNTFDNCEFVNIKGTDSNGLKILTDIKFISCKGDIIMYNIGNRKIEICDSNLNLLNMKVTGMTTSGVIEISNCNIDNFSKNGIVPLSIKDSRITISGLSLFNGNDNTIENSIMSLSPSDADYYPKGTFKNCQLTMSATMNNASENRVTLENCYIDGAATQAAFKGTATDCVFKNNANSGTSVQIPLYNLALGQTYYCTDLDILLIWNGYVWKDAVSNFFYNKEGSIVDRCATTLVTGYQFRHTDRKVYQKGNIPVLNRLISLNNGYLSNGSCQSTRYDIEGAKTIRFLNVLHNIANPQPRVAYEFDDADGNVISGYRFGCDTDTNLESTSTKEYIITDIPANAKYFYVVSKYYTILNDDNFYIYIDEQPIEVPINLRYSGTQWNNDKGNLVIDYGMPYGVANARFLTDAAAGTYKGVQIYCTDLGCKMNLVKVGSTYKWKNFDDGTDVVPTGTVGNVTISIDSTTGETTLSCDTAGATIYYTIDGDNSLDTDSKYDSTSKPILNDGETIKARAFLKNYAASDVVSETYQS